MRSLLHGSRRILPVLLAVGLIAALAAACGDDSTTSGTSTGGSPTIEFQTPAGSSTAASSPSSEATTAPSSEASPSGSPAATGPVELSIDAKDTKFDKDKLTVPAGAQVVVHFTNDDKIIHNFSVLTKKDGDPIYTGDLFKGPDVTKDEKFTAPAKAGDYYFLCDVHPDQMNGTLVVQ